MIATETLCSLDSTNPSGEPVVDALAGSEAEQAISDAYVVTSADLGAMVVRNAGDTSGPVDRNQGPDGIETTPEDEYPDVNYNDDRIPPTWRDEHGEGERRILLVGDAYDFFLSREKRPLPEGKTYEKDVRLDSVAAQKIEGDQGVAVGLLLSEMLNNYIKFCAKDIKDGKDSGNRPIVVSMDSNGVVFIDYYVVNDEVTRLTFNTYAITFGQNPELITEQDRREDPACEQREQDELEGRKVAKVAQAAQENRTALFRMVMYGPDGTPDNPAESGRALPMMRFYAPEDMGPSIERYGEGGRGAHLQLVVGINPLELSELDLDSFLDL